MRRPARQPFRQRLTVLDEGLVRQDRRTKIPVRLVGEPQLDEVGEGLEEYRIGPAFEERFGLLHKDSLRQLRTDGTYRGERTSERSNGPEDERPSPVPAAAPAALRARLAPSAFTSRTLSSRS